MATENIVSGMDLDKMEAFREGLAKEPSQTWP